MSRDLGKYARKPYDRYAEFKSVTSVLVFLNLIFVYDKTDCYKFLNWNCLWSLILYKIEILNCVVLSASALDARRARRDFASADSAKRKESRKADLLFDWQREAQRESR